MHIFYALMAGIGNLSHAIANNNDGISCKSITIQNKVYDLSLLDKDWNIGINSPMIINPCNFIKKSEKACPLGKSFFCILDQENRKGLSYVGSFTNYNLSKDGDLLLLYGKADSFHSNGFPMIAMIKFHCDPLKNSGPEEPIVNLNTILIQWNTRHACFHNNNEGIISGGDDKVTHSALSSLYILLYGFLIIFIGYFGIGFLYKKLILKEAGWNALPHGSWIKDKVDFILELSRNIYRRLFYNQGGYQTI